MAGVLIYTPSYIKSPFLLIPFKETQGCKFYFNVVFENVIEQNKSKAEFPGELKNTDYTQSFGTLNILIAEDNYINQKVAARMLEKMNYNVTLVVNGQEAIDAVAKTQFDIVLMDVHMPKMDGFEATRLIREKEKITGDHLPIIALTANAMKGDREKCMDAGVDEYISKPIVKDDLTKAFFNVLKKTETVNALSN